jgi:hypothetical protein
MEFPSFAFNIFIPELHRICKIFTSANFLKHCTTRKKILYILVDEQVMFSLWNSSCFVGIHEFPFPYYSNIRATDWKLCGNIKLQHHKQLGYTYIASMVQWL